MRVWLSLVYKFIDNCQIEQLFSEFIQTQKRYPTSLDKMGILTLKLLVTSSYDLTPRDLTPYKMSHICRSAFNQRITNTKGNQVSNPDYETDKSGKKKKLILLFH